MEFPDSPDPRGVAFRVPADLTEHVLGDGCRIYCGRLPEALTANESQFEDLWELHPDEYHEIHLHGRRVKTPRWQQAYGADYHYTGQTNRALPIPTQLQPLHQWCESEISERLNGVLLNWYDGALKHYIGAHRDSVANMVAGAPIVTISFGESRLFRLRPWKSKSRPVPTDNSGQPLPSFIDFPADHGTLFIMPFETNRWWTHEVPHAAKRQQRRISITLRAFVTERVG